MNPLNKPLTNQGAKLLILLAGPVCWSLCAWFFVDNNATQLEMVHTWGAASQTLCLTEPWRWITASLLHLSASHLIMNGIGLMAMGIFGLHIFGIFQLFTVTWVTAWCGTAAALWQPGFVIGSSAAIFGILGAILAFSLRRISETQWTTLIFASLVALAMSALTPGDFSAHFAGLISGALVGVNTEILDHTCPQQTTRRRRRAQWVVIIQFTACVLVLFKAY